jgi:hypothetical protein
MINSKEEAKLVIWYANACTAYKNSDSGRWEAARWCAKIVGKYERGATIGLAEDMGVSCDTIENLAHAYTMFIEFCSKQKYRKATRMSREMPRVYYSHFRALYTARNRYKLSLDEAFGILRDIVLDEGGISSRDIDAHIRDRYGKVKDWMHYGERVMKAQASMHKSHDLPDEVRKLSYALFNCLGTNITDEGDIHQLKGKE